MTLDQLDMGESAIVTGLTSTGVNRRHLMDLGILPGTIIIAEMVSPLGEPTAYRVRGAMIALRHEQARQIQIEIRT
jgi:ferrous iron transport protein A